MEKPGPITAAPTTAAPTTTTETVTLFPDEVGSFTTSQFRAFRRSWTRLLPLLHLKNRSESSCQKKTTRRKTTSTRSKRKTMRKFPLPTRKRRMLTNFWWVTLSKHGKLIIQLGSVPRKTFSSVDSKPVTAEGKDKQVPNLSKFVETLKQRSSLSEEEIMELIGQVSSNANSEAPPKIDFASGVQNIGYKVLVFLFLYSVI